MAPLRAHEVRGEAALRALAEELYGERDPAARFAERRPFRIQRAGGRAWLEIDLPGALEGGGRRRRRAATRSSCASATSCGASRSLPRSPAARVGRARLEGGRLRIELAP